MQHNIYYYYIFIYLLKGWFFTIYFLKVFKQFHIKLRFLRTAF